MNFFRLYTVGILLFGLTMAVHLAVVCLLYSIYLDAQPQMREEWPALLHSTLLFCVVTVVAGGAFLGLRRDARWKWAAQAALALTLVGVTYGFKLVLTD